MRIKVSILPLAIGTAIKSLQFSGIDVSNLGSDIGPMAFVPSGSDSAKAKAAQFGKFGGIAECGICNRQHARVEFSCTVENGGILGGGLY